MTASWRDDPAYQDAIRPSDAIATLERELGTAQDRLTLAKRINRQAINFDPSTEETRAQVAPLRQARAAAVEAAQAYVARLETLLNDERMRHSVAIGEAAARAIQVESEQLTDRLKQTMPRLLTLITEVAPLALEIADIAQTIERDMGDPIARKLGAGLACPGPVPLVGWNFMGWLALARAAGWTEPQTQVAQTDDVAA